MCFTCYFILYTICFALLTTSIVVPFFGTVVPYTKRTGTVPWTQVSRLSFKFSILLAIGRELFLTWLHHDTTVASHPGRLAGGLIAALTIATILFMWLTHPDGIKGT